MWGGRYHDIMSRTVRSVPDGFTQGFMALRFIFFHTFILVHPLTPPSRARARARAHTHTHTHTHIYCSKTNTFTSVYHPILPLTYFPNRNNPVTQQSLLPKFLSPVTFLLAYYIKYRVAQKNVYTLYSLICLE